MDPMDYFLYEEYINPGMRYECQKCGTPFGDECVTWDEDAQCHIAVCPACGERALLDEDIQGKNE